MVSAIAHELVAAARLDEAEIALWTGSLDTARGGSLDSLSKRLQRGFVAGVGIRPWAIAVGA
jgi:hypothetical protein